MKHEINSIIESAANLRNSITGIFTASIDKQIERNKEFQQAITKQLNDNGNHRLHREDSTQR
jgi:hypothetical protein